MRLGGGRLTAFLSTYVNKVDRKGRVSVPAPFRAVLSGSSFPGLIAYPSLRQPAVEVFGREVLDELNARRISQSLEGGDFEQVLLGGGDPLVEAVMPIIRELPFDGEGRIILPAALVAHAGIEDQAAFVGRGNRFQIWAPSAFEAHQQQTIAGLRDRIAQATGRPEDGQ